MENQKQYYNTNELADLLRVKPATIRRGLCVDGHYLGLQARKLGNNRLLWEADRARRLIEPEA